MESHDIGSHIENGRLLKVKNLTILTVFRCVNGCIFVSEILTFGFSEIFWRTTRLMLVRFSNLAVRPICPARKLQILREYLSWNDNVFMWFHVVRRSKGSPNLIGSLSRLSTITVINIRFACQRYRWGTGGLGVEDLNAYWRVNAYPTEDGRGRLVSRFSHHDIITNFRTELNLHPGSLAGCRRHSVQNIVYS